MKFIINNKFSKPIDKKLILTYNKGVQYIVLYVYLKIVQRGDFMLAVNYSTVRENLKNYCDKASDENETVIVTRKNEKNVVIISLDNYNELMKAVRNAEYLAKIDLSIEQLKAGKGQQHELIEVDDE